MDHACNIESALADGIPDMPVTGGWDEYQISGTTKSGITQRDTEDGRSYFLGSYSHTTGAVSYYIKGESSYCSSYRRAQILWKCGDRHMEMIS